MESGIHFVESRIRDSLGFPYMEQYLTKHLIDKTSTSAGISDLLCGWNYSQQFKITLVTSRSHDI